jgi:hypothetical protein
MAMKSRAKEKWSEETCAMAIKSGEKENWSNVKQTEASVRLSGDMGTTCSADKVTSQIK